MLVARGRIEIDRPIVEWLDAALALPGVELLHLTPEIAARSTELALRGDPSDRLIVATALIHAAPLVTKDERLHEFGRVDAIG